jgi:hypothetical protein
MTRRRERRLQHGVPRSVRITEVFRLPPCQRHQACLGLECDCRLATMARAVVECSHRPFDHGALDAPLDGLMMQSERPDLVECSVEVSRANRSPRNVADFRLEPSLIKASAKGIDLCQWNPRPSAYANYIVGSLVSRDKYHICDL